MPKTVANQKVIIKLTESLKDSEHHFHQRTDKDENDAIRNLKEYELKLYLRLTQNSVGYDYAFSPKALADDLGGSERSWRDALKGLEEKGYIELKKGNVYEIRESLKEKDESIVSSWDF